MDGTWSRRPHVLCALLVCACICLLQVTHASPMRGLPLLRHFGVAELPAPPTYPGAVMDRSGTVYAGSDGGVMIFRSGVWELFEIPGQPAVYSLLLARDGDIYVGGDGVFGRLRQRPDGTLAFTSLMPRLAAAGSLEASKGVYSLGETSRGIHAICSNALFVLKPDGSTVRHVLPAKASQRVLVVGDEILARVAGEGLYRVAEAGLVPVSGTQALAQVRVSAAWPYKGGVLLVTTDGLHFSEGGRLRRLQTDADAVLKQHTPHFGIQLAEGGFVLGSYDGTLVQLSPELELLGSFRPTSGGVGSLLQDRGGGVWVTSEDGLTRVALSSPWTRYDQHHGLGVRLYDSAWHDGRLWVASGMGVWSTESANDGSPVFSQRPWPNRDLEAFVLQSTDAGLLVGDRFGVKVLDPGATQPRRLLDGVMGTSVRTLLPSSFDTRRMLAVGGGEAAWLVLRGLRWQVAAHWRTGINETLGVYELAPGEVWAGTPQGDVHRWRFDPHTGQLLARQRYGAAQGLAVDADGRGTRLFRSDGVLYAISGTQVRKWQGERFVPAALPHMPGLEWPWQLQGVENAKGSFAWTSRRLWWRKPGQNQFRLQRLSDNRVPGFTAVALHADGNLRVVARDSILQLDASMAEPPMEHPQVVLDRIELHQPQRDTVLLPLSPGGTQALPAGAGLAFRFGTRNMESEVEFRYRMSGHHEQWSDWGKGRELAYQRLPAGQFTFEVQARVPDGTPIETLHYRLQVAPFWYERGTVQVLLGLLLVLAGVGVVRLRNRSVNARNRELERRIAERTAELEDANARLAVLAVTDGLTGIANRRAMEKALQRAWQRCAERGESLAVLMIDVDHFKHFNDTYGHHVGDMQLRRIADVLATEVADAEELAARYGGEEFVLILPATDCAAATARAERIRQKVGQVAIEIGLPMTVSIGVAATYPRAGEDPAELMRCADQVLYRVKRGGRNQVAAAEMEVATGELPE